LKRRRYHCGGLRINPNYIASFKTCTHIGDDESDPSDSMRDDPVPPLAPYLSPRAHLENLNELQRLATSRPAGIPLHMSIDFEGGMSTDIMRGGYPLFPSAMGLACSRSEDLVYSVARATARILRASGVTNVHSPVLDINSNPDNPEINIRSFGDTPRKVVRFARATCQGYMDGGLIPTGKHFPGRGDSGSDAHYDIVVCRHGKEHLLKNELYPYVQLIKTGLPSIMLAHQIVPALGDAKLPITISRPVIQDFIRKQLDFNGVITTDSMQMEGIKKICSPSLASARAIAAGVDLVLFKDEDLEEVASAIKTTVDFVRNGQISQERLSQSVVRVLTMKRSIGLLKTKGANDPAKLEKLLVSPSLSKLVKKAAQHATLLVRDTKKLLPLKCSQKILVVEQSMFMARFCNDECFHPYMLWEMVRKVCPEADLFKLGFYGEEHDLKELLSKVNTYDAVIASNTYSGGSMPNTGFLSKLARKVRNLVVVTNTPYLLTVADSMDCVLCCFSDYSPSLQVAVEIMFGRQQPGRYWPIRFRP